jgi:tripartite-type tricarboxylate transporter receptor subunit TctC
MIAFRKPLTSVLAALGAALLACAAQAQPAAFPSRPVTVIVPFSAGGTADVLARVLAEKVGAELGQPVVVDNKSGGDGIIGAQAAARARPDGYTLLQVSTAHVILPSLRQDIPYDWRRDFVPVFGASGVPQAVVVSGKSNIRSLADLATAARTAPAGINYASVGTGSIIQLTAARLVQALKLKATHVPYRGLSNAVQAVLGEQVQFTVVNMPDVIEQVKAGTLRLLAVTSEQRLPYLPNVPTLAEQGFADATVASWSAYVAPASTPPEIVERLHLAYAKAAADPAVRERLGKLGLAFNMMSGPQLGKFMADEAARWRRVIEDNHIKLEN